MKNFKLLIQYDGNRYNGWQKQKNTSNTIQEKIQNVIKKMTGEDIELYGSGRTDAGTHAIGQTANFHWDTEKDGIYVKNYLNKFLPNDIAVISTQEVNERFHSRLNAKGKKYLYRVLNTDVSDVFKRNYTFFYSEKLDIEKMRKGAAYFCGEHDFKSFCTKSSNKKTTIRTIYSIDINKNGDEIEFLFYGNGFLYNMVRIITGTLMDIGEGKIEPECVVDIIKSKSRYNAGITVPAHGLYLLEVIY